MTSVVMGNGTGAVCGDGGYGVGDGAAGVGGLWGDVEVDPMVTGTVGLMLVVLMFVVNGKAYGALSD